MAKINKIFFNTRLLTFSVLLPLFVWLLLYSSYKVFLVVTSTFIIIAYLEWQKLLPKVNNFINIILLFLLFFFSNKKYLLNFNFVNINIIIASIFWLFVSFGICCKSKILNNNYLILIASFLLFIPSWLAINYLYSYSNQLLTLGCLIIIAADVGAYLVGNLYGKHQLTKISPKKTWEGVIGGYISALLITIIYILLFNHTLKFAIKIITIASITVFFSIIGDLFESIMKRQKGVKDSGNLLPGHGGILDRIDSFCAGIPIFTLGVLNLLC